MTRDYFQARDILKFDHGEYVFYRLDRLEIAGLVTLSRLPYSIRVMLESVLRQCNEVEITRQDVINLAGWKPKQLQRPSLPYLPARVLMQDFTGVPAVVDLAAMRTAMARLGGDPQKINPMVPVDLVIDHSVQVDFFASPDAIRRNADLEFQRNRERYEFLHWGQGAFDRFRVVPPATGIVHQVNLEYLSPVVQLREENGEHLVYPDTLVGTDSHTTMINGLGVVGWGVGGIEAEAAILGQPIDMLTPDVIGFKLYGELPEGVTATDLTLTVTQMLREKGVVEKFVEFYGPGLSAISLPDRATLANMAPEYGATIGYFPIDNETLNYLRLTGRSADQVELIEKYCVTQKLFRTDELADPEFTDVLELDLGTVLPSISGPKRPQDRMQLSVAKDKFRSLLTTPLAERGYGLHVDDTKNISKMGTNGGSVDMTHGAVVIAAITSCTNTSNPSVMVAAGLVAKKAVDLGLSVKPYVKTSLAPGSRVVKEYLEKAGVLEPLANLGFNIVGYGCTTCIGNSGPLPGEVVKAITDGDLVAAAVLSGNRNFEGRIHPYVRANFLASPPLVVAYALAGTVQIDLTREPIGKDRNGVDVFLSDIWPSNQEVQEAITSAVSIEMFIEKYADVFTSNKTWNDIQTEDSQLYNWDLESTYIQEPPFFVDITPELQPIKGIHNARVLVMLGDSVTTDHISPAGTFTEESPAGVYLIENGIDPRDFNTYGSRRGNDRIMTRGTFANIRLKNNLVPGVEGGVTVHFPDGEIMSIYSAAMKYQREGVPLIVIAGKEYGTGSSRDWAAKGTLLLGVKAVIAESFERIHRSNLVGMGVLPLEFQPGENVNTLGLSGNEILHIEDIREDIQPLAKLTVRAVKNDGSVTNFDVNVRLDTQVEITYYRNGGILHTVLRNLLID